MPENCDVVPQELFLVVRNGKPLATEDHDVEVFLSREDAEVGREEEDEVVGYCKRAAFDALREERDGLATRGLSWQPIETFARRKEYLTGQRVLLLPVKGEGVKLFRVLPGEYFYDFADNENTYYEARLFSHWMLIPAMPGSQREGEYTAILADRDRRVGSAIAARALRALRQMTRPAFYNHQVWFMVAVEDIEFAAQTLELEAKK